MISLHTLASSSSGNCLLIHTEDTYLLIDAGISCRSIKQQLSALGISLQQLSAVLLTHTHTDHVCGCLTLLKQVSCPCYASVGTAFALGENDDLFKKRIIPVPVGQELVIGSCRIRSFPTKHDSPGSVGYRLDHEDGSIGILTDTGVIPLLAKTQLEKVDLVVLESNYDAEMLKKGPYPYSLKQRIRGDYGHLCNDVAAAFAIELVQKGTQGIVLAHLSKENNLPEKALHCTKNALEKAGCLVPVTVAPRNETSKEFRLCKKSLFCV